MTSRPHRGERGGAALNLLLAILLLGLILAHWLVLPDPSRRNWEFLPDMVESVARNGQAPVPSLPDGAIPDLRPPVGSVARGYLPPEYGATPEEALRAGAELSNPFHADDAEALARGEFIFTNFCVVCHGPTGKGDGAAVRRGVPPPPSLLLEHALQMPDGQIYHLISLGQGNMASYASQVERDDRWKVILHLRALQAAGLRESAAAPEGAAEPGEGT